MTSDLRLPTRGWRARREIHPLTKRTLLWTAPILLALSVFYLFLASAGTFHDLQTQRDYYDLMAEGFRAGHLYIKDVPSPELLAKDDPFRYENIQLWIWDATLYKGRYYLYWGPVPALLLLAYKIVMGSHERITDQWPTALFMIGRLWAGAALILSIASRAKLRQPPWIACLAIAVFGLGNPTPFIVARPHVYEAALAGGQCFLFWGLVAAFWGLELGRLRTVLFAVGGFAWALAIGCRVTNFFCVPVVLANTAAFAWYNSERKWRPWVRDCLALGAPVAAVAVGYGIYNYLRFGAVTEFGVSYQLTMQPFWGNDRYVWPNVFSYLFAPVKVSCRFPFFWIERYRELSKLIEWPSGYQSFELVGGIMLTTGWCWLACIIGIRLLAHLRTTLGAPRPSDGASRMTSHEAWLLTTALATMVAIVPVLPLWEASMRYVEDATGGILLIATSCAFWLVRRTDVAKLRISRWLSRMVVATLGLQSAAVGSLIAFRSYEDPFMSSNPVLYQELEQRLSVCPKNHPEAPHE